jgi:SNF2 family DNA or RNA helicase
LGDPVGLGKTAQAIATAHSLMPNPINKVLIICPSGLRYNWQNEINKVIGLTSSVAMKGFDEREATYKQWTKTKWLVCSYDSIKQLADIDILQPLVDDKTLMILDEAQSIKNWRPLRSKAVRRLIRGAYGCIPVSATFMENNLGELYNIVSLVSREIFGGNKKLFLSRYVDSDAEGKPTSYRNLDEVHRRLAPFLLRRKKEDVSSQIVEKIPSRTITTDYWVDLTPSQHAAYAKLIHDSITLDTGEKINVVNALQRLMLRRQVCLFPELVGLKGISAKSAAIVDVINSFEKETKLIVFTWFRESARMITQILESHGMKAIALVGDERDNVPELVKRFNEDSSIRVMVANDFMKAGHNLQVASAIINFDLLWNPMSLEQRRGRIDRIGQKSDIISVINILTKGTIEEVMWLKLQGKIGLFSEVIEGEEPRLTTRDIRAIVTKERELFEENKG